MTRTSRLALVGALLAATPAAAQQGRTLASGPDQPVTRVGTRATPFLQIGVGARAQALAGAYAALADDMTALYWNPAGIASVEGFTAGVSYNALYEGSGISHTFAGAVLPLGVLRLGVSVNTLNSGDMPWTTEDFPNAGFGGENDPLRADFQWQSLAIGLHLARPITDRLMVGGAAKYITEGIPGADVNFVAVDLGTTFRTGLFGVTLGASLQNVGTSGHLEGARLQRRLNTQGSESQIDQFNRIVDAAFRTSEVQLPTLFRFSIATDLIGDATAIIAPNPNQTLRVVADVSDAVDTDLQSALALEYSYRNLAFLRVGKRWTNEAQIDRGFSHGASLGGGVRIPIGVGRLYLDYAYTRLVDLENVQVFTAQVQF